MFLFLSEKKNRTALWEHCIFAEMKRNTIKRSPSKLGEKTNPKPEEKTETFLSCGYKDIVKLQDKLHCLFAYNKIFCCVNQILKIMCRA